MSDFRVNDSVGFFISKTNGSMAKYFNQLIRLQGIDASVEQWGVLNIAQARPGISQTDLARMNNRDKTTITRMLDLLERKGYICRKEDDHDRRLYHIFLTKQGEQILQQLIPLAEAVNRVSCEGLSQQEIELLKKMLKQISSNVTHAIQTIQET